jgi:hypothetical protein
MPSSGQRKRTCLLAAGLAIPLLTCTVFRAHAGWEAGAKAGYESNLSRSIDDGEGSGYVTAYAGYVKTHSGESRLDWTMGLTFQGSVYPSLTDLNSLSATFSPGLMYIFHPGWSVAVTPFVQGEVVQDTDQSAVSFGARVDFSQKFEGGLYLGEYYVYTDSRANNDVYSYVENAVGAYLGMRWGKGIFAEVGYEFGRGDSFLSVKVPVASGGGGQGNGRGTPQYSQAFDAQVFKENVDFRTIPVTVGFDWSKRWFSLLNYTYRSWAGDSGTATDHSGYAGIGYRF